MILTDGTPTIAYYDPPDGDKRYLVTLSITIKAEDQWWADVDPGDWPFDRLLNDPNKTACYTPVEVVSSIRIK